MTDCYGAITYNYDAADQLTGTADTATNRPELPTNEPNVDFIYDGDGNRIGMSVMGSAYANYTYVNDILSAVARVLVEEDTVNGTTNTYFYAGRLIAREGPEGTIFLHPDGLGSIMAVTDVYGEPLVRYAYDAFGNLRSTTNDVYSSVLFVGEWQDPTGLIYLRARYYDPATGRFLSRDPNPGELNDPSSLLLYAYCGNNPVLYVDPSGELKVCWVEQLKKEIEEEVKYVKENYYLDINLYVGVGGGVVKGIYISHKGVNPYAGFAGGGGAAFSIMAGKIEHLPSPGWAHSRTYGQWFGVTFDSSAERPDITTEIILPSEYGPTIGGRASWQWYYVGGE